MGRRICGYLTAQGLTVKAFIDKNASGLLPYNSIPILFPSEFAQSCTFENTVVVISILNYFEHDDIANKLHDLGFLYILGKFNILYQKKSKCTQNVNCIFGKLIKGGNLVGEIIFPYSYDENPWFSDNSFICRRENLILAYIPIELMFFSESSLSGHEKLISLCFNSDRQDLFQVFYSTSEVESGNIIGRYCNASVAVQKEHRREVPDDYYKCLIAGRFDIYENMEMAYNLNPSFFLDNPPAVEYRENGIFVVKDGTHRISFLMTKGCCYFPCLVSEKDYSKWINEDKIFLPCESKLEQPILHPYYFSYPRLHHWIKRNLLFNILCFLKRYYGQLNELSICDYKCKNGYYTQYFLNNGCRVLSCDTEKKLELLKKALLLCNTDTSKLQLSNCIPDKEQFDVILDLSDDELFIADTQTPPLYYFIYGACGNRIKAVEESVGKGYSRKVLYEVVEKGELKKLFVFFKN